MDVVEAVKQFLLASGAGWVLWLLGVLSVATVAVAVERWLSYRGQATDVPVLARMRFNRLTVPYVLNGTDPAAALRDYRDFMNYNQSTQGHVNADGLCFVQRNYPSPP
jgi:hypothetical protein